MTTAWLPCLVLLECCGGNWARYVEVVYGHFKRDFVDSKPTFCGSRLRLKRYPMENGKEATFWHMISEGKVEADRLPDLRRCERICWPRPLIEKAPAQELRVWKQTRNRETRIAIAVPDFSYIVVLAERSEGNGVYYLPWTAFFVEHENGRRRYEKEWSANKLEAQKTEAALVSGFVAPSTHGG